MNTVDKESKEVASDLMSERSQVLAYLQSLKAAYTSTGVTGLQQALNAQQQPGTMVHSKQTGLQTVLAAASGIQTVVTTIDQNLATAEARKTFLNVALP